jgi:L-2-hydroxyglutarate oxidase LhgO
MTIPGSSLNFQRKSKPGLNFEDILMADIAVTVIGGGVVGLAIAAELSRSYTPLYLLERNPKYGQETSARNSEVIHAGIYYPPNSLKARLCVEGKNLLYELCARHEIPHQRITKIITATKVEEEPELERLYRLGTGNGVELTMLSAAEVHALEPNIDSVGGIHSPSTGIISAHGLMDFYAHTAKAHGAEIQTRCTVVGIEQRSGGYDVCVEEDGVRSSFSSEWVINAAGLESDTIASLVGIDVDREGYRIHYCKGSYFALPGSMHTLVRRLVYPVPTKHSLGVHVVLDLGGRIKFGPDVEYLPDRQQNYTVDPAKRDAFAESARRLLPILRNEDFAPDMSGIRAKIQAKGDPQKDFIIRHEADRGLPGFINLVGMESPGLTASPAIARYVSGLMKAQP